MRMVAPAGAMYQAGTLSGNPLAMTAGLVTIRTLLENNTFNTLVQKTATLATGIAAAASENNIPIQVNYAGSMFGFYFLNQADCHIKDYASAKQFAHTERYAAFFHAMLEASIYFAPSQFEAGFMSTAHSDDDIQQTLTAVQQVFTGLASA